MEVQAKAKVAKEMYSRKVKLKKNNKYDNKYNKRIRKDNETKAILKTINQRRLTKKKRVSNQWPDHST